MLYTVEVRENRPAGTFVTTAALLTRYQTIEAAARAARGAARRHARSENCDVLFRVLGDQNQLATGGLVRADLATAA